MDDVHAKKWADAARRYAVLRRGYWRFFLGGVAVFAAFGAPLLAFGHRLDPSVVVAIAVPMGAAFLACYLGAFVTWARLVRFRCPRCGGRFVLAPSSSWPATGCKHCGLELG